MSEEALLEALKSKSGLSNETLRSCLNALALIMNRDLAEHRIFDMPDVGQLSLVAPAGSGRFKGEPSPLGPALIRDAVEGAIAGTVVARIEAPSGPKVFRYTLPPTGANPEEIQILLVEKGEAAEKPVQHAENRELAESQ